MSRREWIRRLAPTLAVVVPVAVGCQQGGGGPTAPPFEPAGLEEQGAEKKGGGGPPSRGSSDEFGVAIGTLLGDAGGPAASRSSYETGFALGRKSAIEKDLDTGAGFANATPDLLAFLSSNFDCSFSGIKVHNSIRVESISKRRLVESRVSWEFVATPGSMLHTLVFHGEAAPLPPAVGASVGFEVTAVEIVPGNKRHGCTDRNGAVAIPVRVHNFGSG